MNSKSINNKDKIVNRDNQSYLRIPVKTHLIMPNENLLSLIEKYAIDEMKKGDILFIAESVVSITQGRAYEMNKIHPRKLARFLSTKVSHNPGGIGLTCPEMMEMAFQEVGTIRMLTAAAASVIGKIFGKKGWFYIVAGSKVRGIDGPDEYKIPPYNNYVVLTPKNPNKLAAELSSKLNCQVVIVDINDLGQNILGNSIYKDNVGLTDEEIATILNDNPLGQGSEQTPLGLIRPL